MDIEVFVHPTCSTCHALLQRLHRWGLMDKVRIIDTSRDPYMAIERGVRSVPSIFINGELMFAGIIDFNELHAILTGSNKPSQSVEEDELIQAFLRGVLDSVATALWLYVNEDCSALLRDEKTLKAMMGIGDEELRRFIKSAAKMDCSALVSRNEESFLRVIATNFTREVYWVLGAMKWENVGRLYTRESLAHWMIVRSALGRVGLRPHRLSEPVFSSKVAKVQDYLGRNFDELMSKVIKEQEEIAKDWPKLV
ncbi:MAG: thioredoxin family protein [Thermocladium sp.]|nr:MAG: hypothetical protein AT710_03370 [Thermocladium sp. ECH_B]